MSDLVLAIDQGTTGTTVFVIDSSGRVRGRAYREIRQYYPRPGWVEHDAEEIARSAIGLAKAALQAARAKASDLRTIGITNQRETFLLWERGSGKPLHRAIVWQCRRSAAICKALQERERLEKSRGDRSCSRVRGGRGWKSDAPLPGKAAGRRWVPGGGKGSLRGSGKGPGTATPRPHLLPRPGRRARRRPARPGSR